MPTWEDATLARLRTVVDAPASTPPPSRDDDAAVLLLLDPAHDGLPLLFIRRTRRVPSHRGQIAFPGGATEREDGGPVGTALREAQEEVGVDPAAVEVLGLLQPVFTATSFRRLTPVVGLQTRPHASVGDPFEVAEVFSIALRELMTAPVTARQIPGAPDGTVVRFYEAAGRVIWGATAAVLHDLLARLGRTD